MRDALDDPRTNPVQDVSFRMERSKTKYRLAILMAEDAVACEPFSWPKFPANREEYREICKLG